MREPKVSKHVTTLLKKFNKGIKLDVGCGESKQEGFVGMDIRKCKGVDIIHSAEKFPYPLPKNCCSSILCSHLIEHIKPWLMIDLFNEFWRIMQEGGQLLIGMPYGWSFGFIQDPTHCNACNEATWSYYDPDHALYCIYRPLPWRIVRNSYQSTGNMEVILEKRNKNYVGVYTNKRLDGSPL